MHVTALVLASRAVREADRLYTVLTKEQGKMEVLARGGLKPLAKLTPHLESCAELQLTLVGNRDYPTVIGVERLHSFSTVRPFHTLLLIQNATALVDLSVRPQEVDTAPYELLYSFFEEIHATPEVPDQERAGYVLGAFALKLLSLSGYRPEMFTCLSCRNSLQPQAYVWHSVRGGAVCQACIQASPESWSGSRVMSDEVIKLLRFALEEPFQSQHKPYLRGEVLSQFHETLEALLSSHFPTIPANSIRGACVI